MKSLKQLLMDDSYFLMESLFNIDNYYPYKKDGNAIWTFMDKFGNKHLIRAMYQASKLFGHEDGYYEIKFGMYFNGKLIYDDLPENDEKVLNTHIRIALKEILEKFNDVVEWRIPPVENDVRRYRLFRRAINSLVDNSMWSMETNPKDHKNVIWLKRK